MLSPLGPAEQLQGGSKLISVNSFWMRRALELIVLPVPFMIKMLGCCLDKTSTLTKTGADVRGLWVQSAMCGNNAAVQQSTHHEHSQGTHLSLKALSCPMSCGRTVSWTRSRTATRLFRIRFANAHARRIAAGNPCEMEPEPAHS